MDTKTGLIFQLVDLRPEGVCLQGEISFAELDIQEEGRFSFPEPLKYNLLLTPLGDKSALLRGCLQTRIAIICDRCNGSGKLPLKVEDVCHKYENPFGKLLDLTPEIREDILMTFPQHFLCREDCRGLCFRCGENLNTGSCACGVSKAASPSPEDTPLDNPWQDLDKLQLP